MRARIFLYVHVLFYSVLGNVGGKKTPAYAISTNMLYADFLPGVTILGVMGVNTEKWASRLTRGKKPERIAVSGFRGGG